MGTYDNDENEEELAADPYQGTIIDRIPFISAKKFLYLRQGPWPQPAPNRPFGMSPAVVHTPKSEKADFHWHIGLRYLKQLLFRTPSALLTGLKTDIVDTTSNQFGQLFHDTIFSKLLNPNLDENDRRLFAEVLQADQSYFKVDLAVMKHVRPYPGQFTAPCVGLFKRVPEGIHAVAIHINSLLITEKDQEAFELAKHYLIQGASNVVTLAIHPLLHLPFDAINAVTKTALPKDHVLLKLLLPHTRFSLELNRTVTLSQESILKNWPSQIYGPYPGPSEGLQDLFVAGFNGVKNNSSYPPYVYPLEPKENPTPYGDFLRTYYETIYRYVDSIIQSEHFPKNCPYVKAWADYISHWTVGFPNGREIFEENKLVSAVTMFIWDTSVAHSLDHKSFGDMPMDKVTMRMRLPPPSSTNMDPFDRNDLVTAIDTMKFEMAQIMFYRPTTVTRLIDVDYQFAQPELIALNKMFHHDLRATARKLENNTKIALEDIAASVQY